MDQLLWLPQHSDLSAAIGEAKRETDPIARLAQATRLAGYRRDFTQTTRLDRLASEGLQALTNSETPTPGLRSLRIALLASHTVDHLVPAIRVAGLQRRLAISVHVAPYGMYRQALLMEGAELTRFAPQLIVLALDARDAPLQLPLEASQAEVDAAVSGRVDELRLLWRRARERYAAQVVQQTIVPADPPLFGSFEALVPASPCAVIERLNAAIRTAAREDGVLLMDLAWEAARGSYGDGLAEPVRWHQAKQLVSPNLAPLYGDQLATLRCPACTARHHPGGVQQERPERRRSRVQPSGNGTQTRRHRRLRRQLGRQGRKPAAHRLDAGYRPGQPGVRRRQPGRARHRAP